MGKSATSPNDSVSSQFQATAAEVDEIFVSFRSLYDIYSVSLKNLKNNLDGLPIQYQTKVDNAIKILENLSGTVEIKQAEISSQLYTQGLVLLVGNAEALTRELFRTIFRQNIRNVKIGKDISLPLTDILKIKNDKELSEVVLTILEDDKNPAEKLNFQNMKQLQGIMSGYFGLIIKDDYVADLHEFWQIRHIIIHNSAVIDQKFLDNLKKAKVDTKKYMLGSRVIITKMDYEKCFSLLVLLFDNFDAEISRLNLAYKIDE